ncbi:hypothetical protein AMATHDRAFT_11402 [Amanita thiersii Skay4041]|uniref:Uncharacterized protein n=1 Tax=Amanita thiersii Skay4041 TaxID=703135 RepID=A0A2A9NA68_9AGAR|nr:hypothetical protein AMATHDRAFT_11402 [Amanita thiersii Skay4041]
MYSVGRKITNFVLSIVKPLSPLEIITTRYSHCLLHHSRFGGHFAIDAHLESPIFGLRLTA